MKCTITFKVNGKEINLSLETDSNTPLTNQDIITVLENNAEKREELCKALENYTQSIKIKKDVVLEDILENGVMANRSLEDIKRKFDIEFPDGIDNVPILLINNLVINNKNIYGRVLDPYGNEVFVIKNDPSDIKKLADFLGMRKKIQDGFVNIKENSKYKEILKSIKEQIKDTKFKTDEHILLDFYYNKSKYKNIYIKVNSKNSKGKNVEEEVNAYVALQTIINDLMDWCMPMEYLNTPELTEINMFKTVFNNKMAYISYSDLYEILNKYYKDIFDNLGITNQEQMVKVLSKKSSEIVNELPKGNNLNIFNKDSDNIGFQDILTNIFNKEPRFKYKFSNLSKNEKGVLLKQNEDSLNIKYNIGFDTIQSMKTENYLGYKIYQYIDENKKEHYFISRGYLVADSNPTEVTSKEEAYKSIENKIEDKYILRNSFIHFRTNAFQESGELTLPLSFNEKQIIEILNVPIDLSKKPIEYNLLRNWKINDFYEYINSNWNVSDEIKRKIKNNINTPEKVMLFLYKIQEKYNDSREINDIDDIINEINGANVLTYYVESKKDVSTKQNQHKFMYRFVPIDSNILENYKQDQHIPMVQFMNQLVNVFKQKFNVNVNLLTARQIKEKLGDTINVNEAKAFIYNGEIYVNTTIGEPTDLIHEYTHLILGILKADETFGKNYEQLLYSVMNTQEGKDMYKVLENSYKGLSQIDIMEEVFAKLFGEYIHGRSNKEISDIFNPISVSKEIKSIFNCTISQLNNMNLITIFSTFSDSIKDMLLQRDEQLTFDTNIRKYTNYISKQIENKNIEEECI